MIPVHAATGQIHVMLFPNPANAKYSPTAKPGFLLL
jgi:hypothetical protein